MDGAEVAAILSGLGATLAALIAVIGLELKNRRDTREIHSEFSNGVPISKHNETLRDRVDYSIDRINNINEESKDRDYKIKRSLDEHYKRIENQIEEIHDIIDHYHKDSERWWRK